MLEATIITIISEMYEFFLKRAPSTSELEVHIEGFRGGLKLAQLIEGIVLSEEADNLRARNAIILNSSTEIYPATISVPELTKLVYYFYNVFLKRDPRSDELTIHTTSYKNKSSIFHLLEGIARSEEAEELSKNTANLKKDSTNRPLTYSREAIGELVTIVYALALGRKANDSEIDHWFGWVKSGIEPYKIIFRIANSKEAASRSLLTLANQGFSIQKIVQLAFDIIVQEGVTPPELEEWSEKLRTQKVSSNWFIGHLFRRRLERMSSHIPAENVSKNTTQALVPNIFMLGTTDLVDFNSTSTQYTGVQSSNRRNYINSPAVRNKPEILVSAIASMYKGSKYIKGFMDNIVNQTIFKDNCELIIIDANSPEDEYNTIRNYLKLHSNVKYIRNNQRIGIYEAWNQGIKEAQGQFITNTNLDDLRRKDSFERQLECFNLVSIPDIVYQDFIYSSIDGCTNFNQLEREGVICELPIVTLINLMYFNSPHNAPMWRRRLHDDVGWFNTSYKSAGDCDFWLRCASAGKIFYKSNDPHVGYYVNPLGLSTSSETLGVVEHQEILRNLMPALTPKEFYMDRKEFSDHIGETSPDQSGNSMYDTVQERLLSISQITRQA